MGQQRCIQGDCHVECGPVKMANWGISTKMTFGVETIGRRMMALVSAVF